MQKQQYTLFLTRDDGSTRSVRFCGATLRLLVFLCVVVPAVAVIALYMTLQSWQDATILSHQNDLLRQEMYVYQQELQKYATIQQLVTRYEHENSPILMASKAVPAPVPYALEEAEPKDVEPEETKAETTPDALNGGTSGTESGVESRVESDPESGPESRTATGATTDVRDTPKSASAEDILQQQTAPQGTSHDAFAAVTDTKARLTDVTIREQNNSIHTTFTLSNATESTIAGHIYIAVQGHDKKLYPIKISEKHTAFRILRFREYTLNFPLPQGIKAADVDKIVITAKTRDGEVFYCNGFALE